MLIQAWETGHLEHLRRLRAHETFDEGPVWSWQTASEWSTGMLLGLFQHYIAGGRHYHTNIPERIHLTHRDHLLLALGRHVGYSHSVIRLATLRPDLTILYFGPTTRRESERRVKQGRRNIHCADVRHTSWDALRGRVYDVVIFEVAIQHLPDFDAGEIAKYAMPHVSNPPVIMCVADLHGTERPDPPFVHVSPLEAPFDPLGFFAALDEHREGLEGK